MRALQSLSMTAAVMPVMRVMRVMPLLLALIPLLAGCGGCREGSSGGQKNAAASSSASVAAVAPLNESDRSACEEAVRQYFGAMMAQDCDALIKVVKGNYPKADCEHDVKEFAEHHAGLRSIVGSVRDGRDPHGVLVTANVNSGKGEREQIIRVEIDGNGWKVKR